MAEYIDRSQVLALYHYDDHDNPVVDCEDIEGLPAADVAPVRHGEWFESYMSFNNGLTRFYGYKCSECSGFSIGPSRYCPNCGANMMGEPHDE